MSIIRRQISLEMLRIGHLSIVANSPQHGLHLPQDEGRMVDGQTHKAALCDEGCLPSLGGGVRSRLGLGLGVGLASCHHYGDTAMVTQLWL